ncbi:endonuclease/exonuclease/phosphatase [Sorangium cellulosum]|uniref:Endonuclease/exonuclease/phosphatase n=1 Tax=Sorangium cellulosum TaxID=56 RepID=A0A2L0EPS1_SORCE|nr:endonuclease/exonuclease/phosphatase family protein [Sorangium cellulosum]AUX41286.1 endonuclease/exonuclease/phosphatase [Sorangium cellulosum]
MEKARPDAGQASLVASRSAAPAGGAARSPWRRRADRLLAALVWLTLASVVAAWGLLVFLSDRWWPATLLLFGPRWVLAAPVLAFGSLALGLRRRLLLPLAAAAAIVFGPLMGLHVPNPLRPEAAGPRVRVLTQNLGRVKLASEAVGALLTELSPDVAAFQECSPPGDRVSPFAGYTLHVDYNTCLLTRYPIRKVDARDRKDVWQKDGSGAITLYELESPHGVFSLLNLHLDTVRDGLEAIAVRRLSGVPELEANTAARRWESELAREWARRAAGPLLIAGDFNMPVESGIYRDLWSEFTNAFSVAGFGYGFTKKTRLLRARIDHILLGAGWAAERAWVARSIGSDHHGTVADLRWTGAPGGG